MSVQERLAELGVTLPTVTPPAGAYVPTVQTGSLVFTSGQIPVVAGEVQFPGKLGQDVTVEQGYEAARICAINCLAALQAALGDLNRVQRVVKVVGFVASAPGFSQQPKVINGASEFLAAVFGQAGEHARSAVGVAELPLGCSVEVEMVVEIA